MKPACEDTDAISARIKGLERERREALNQTCPHEWGAMDICKNCGTQRAPDPNDGCYC